MKLEDIFVYMVLMIVSFIAGLVGIVTKNKLSKANEHKKKKILKKEIDNLILKLY